MENMGWKLTVKSISAIQFRSRISFSTRALRVSCVLQCVAACCSVLVSGVLRVPECCSVLHPHPNVTFHRHAHFGYFACCSVWWCVAVCCNVLKSVALGCIVLNLLCHTYTSNKYICTHIYICIYTYVYIYV